jgi:hypothetical protein
MAISQLIAVGHVADPHIDPPAGQLAPRLHAVGE